MTDRRATVNDVAHRAGVSRSTVSYVLNNTPGQTIPEATRTRVRQAADDLKYVPSSTARNLRRGKSDWVLVILPDADLGDALVRFLDGVSTAVECHGYSVVYRRQRPGRSINRMWNELLPAAIIAGRETVIPEEAALIERSGIPVVLLPVEDTAWGRIEIPQAAIGRLQASHLTAQGHRRIGYAASEDPHVTFWHEPRLKGVREFCAEHDLPEPMVLPVRPDPEATAASIDLWRAGPTPVTAVCAYNDHIAIMLLAALRNKGLTIPGDCAVIGVDNIDLAPYMAPPLTTIEPHTDLYATFAAHVLLRRLMNDPLPDLDPDALKIELIRRSST